MKTSGPFFMHVPVQNLRLSVSFTPALALTVPHLKDGLP